ncbi:MAG: thioredoxin domain-containing protein [Candidatus Nanopelagicales bacterium]|nr:thioredoxin domain-containing protein [Candidatus Nanopelagicales bacterium]
MAFHYVQSVSCITVCPGCGLCRMPPPILEKLTERYAGSREVVKINVNHNPGLTQKYDASSKSTLVMVRNVHVLDRVSGAKPEPVLAVRIDQHLRDTG